MGRNIRPYMSVLPSAAFTVIGIGGFQPVADERGDVGLLERHNEFPGGVAHVHDWRHVGPRVRVDQVLARRARAACRACRRQA